MKTLLENTLGKSLLIGLVLFLDIEEAFDNTSFKSIVRAASNHGVENTIFKWMDQGHVALRMTY